MFFLLEGRWMCSVQVSSQVNICDLCQPAVYFTTIYALARNIPADGAMTADETAAAENSPSGIQVQHLGSRTGEMTSTGDPCSN